MSVMSTGVVLHEKFNIPYEAMELEYKVYSGISCPDTLHIKENMCKGVDKKEVEMNIPVILKVVWE